ncbi:MAG TPA: SPASM domain-containing protein, partial [Salinivirgaceae bacterium]|nr:SPASM domain-containing protein [Salinivirgaceae bacterium]
TKQHIDKKYETNDISKFLSNEFGIKGIIVEEESLEINRILNYWENIDYDLVVKDNFKYMPDGFWSVLMAIAEKRPRESCPIIKGMFSISSTGLIYPCHVTTGSVKSVLGSIKDKNIFNYKELFDKKQFILDLQDNKKCKSCWGSFLCGGCAIHRFYCHEKKQFLKEPNEKFCKIAKLHLEQTILMIAELRKNPTYWKKLIKKAKEKNIAV